MIDDPDEGSTAAVALPPECPACMAALDSRPPSATPKPGHFDRGWNVAVWKVVKGKGSLLRNLAVLTGLSVNSLKARTKRVEHDYPPEEIEPDDGLDPDEARYMAKRYGASDDPGVREWLQQHACQARSRPDWRPSTDRVPPLGRPTRIRAARDDD